MSGSPAAAGAGDAAADAAPAAAEAEQHRAPRFFAGACDVCGRTPPDVALSGCARCRRVFYCSKAHQREGWAHHRRLCRALNKLLAAPAVAEAAAAVSTRQQLLTFSKQLVALCAQRLGGPLQPRDVEVLVHPRVCCVCFGGLIRVDRGAGGAGKAGDAGAGAAAAAYRLAADVEPCRRCRQAWCCATAACRAKFAKVHPLGGEACMDGLMALVCNQVPTPDGNPLVYLPPHVDEAYAPAPASWEEYFARTEWPALVTPARVLASAPVSYVLAMLRGLEWLSGERAGVDVAAGKSLRLHVVGAALQPELTTILRYELLLHMLPALRSLHLRFVGPALQHVLPADAALAAEMGFTPAPRDATEVLDTAYDASRQRMCPKCSSRGSELHVALSTGQWHEFAARAVARSGAEEDDARSVPFEEAFEPLGGAPDAIVAFHPLFHGSPSADGDSTWTPTLELAHKLRIPVIVTAFTEDDAEMDRARLEAAGYRIARGPESNPLRSQLPLKDPQLLSFCALPPPPVAHRCPTNTLLDPLCFHPTDRENAVLTLAVP